MLLKILNKKLVNYSMIDSVKLENKEKYYEKAELTISKSAF